MDPFGGSAKAAMPGSWNRYTYSANDPVNRRDPSGLDDLTDEDVSGDLCDGVCFFAGSPVDLHGDDGFDVGVDGTGQGVPIGSGPVGTGPTSKYPKCNPTGNALKERQLDFVASHYKAAAAEASSIQTQVGQAINTTALTMAFLDWSSWETGYGQNKANIAENNDFGQQNPSNAAGNWDGSTVPCNKGVNNIPFNTKNACIAAGTTWSQQLNDILDTVSGKTGASYDDALVSSLESNSSEGAASMLQSIANNGYNGSSTYGSKMMGMVSVKCMMDNYLK
jgi:hypothetical protein